MVVVAAAAAAAVVVVDFGRWVSSSLFIHSLKDELFSHGSVRRRKFDLLRINAAGGGKCALFLLVLSFPLRSEQVFDSRGEERSIVL